MLLSIKNSIYLKEEKLEKHCLIWLVDEILKIISFNLLNSLLELRVNYIYLLWWYILYLGSNMDFFVYIFEFGNYTTVLGILGIFISGLVVLSTPKDEPEKQLIFSNKKELMVS